MGTKSNNKCPSKRQKRIRHGQKREEGHVMAEANVGVMHLQVKKVPGAARNCRNELSPRVFNNRA